MKRICQHIKVKYFQEEIYMTDLTVKRKDVPLMLTVRQAAATGVLPERTLRRLIAKKRIPVIRSGRTQYINFGRLVEALEKGEGLIWE
jgi:excisionase family DNA binding protein